MGDRHEPRIRISGAGGASHRYGQGFGRVYPAARAVFDEVTTRCRKKLSALIWEGDIAELTLTQNAQPVLMATSMAAIAALGAEGLGIQQGDFVAGIPWANIPRCAPQGR